MDKKQELEKMENEIEKKKKDIGTLQSEIWGLQSEIEFNECEKKMGNIKLGSWVIVKTKSGHKWVGYFHSYDERDGYELPVFIVSYKVYETKFANIKHIKKISQKEAIDFIKRGYDN